MQIVEHIFAGIGFLAVVGSLVLVVVGTLLGPSSEDPDYDY